MKRNKPKKDLPISVKCAECANATLMQWGEDPLIADCRAHKCREVASHKRNCKEFVQEAHLPKTIQRFVKQVGLQINLGMLNPKRPL